MQRVNSRYFSFQNMVRIRNHENLTGERTYHARFHPGLLTTRFNSKTIPLINPKRITLLDVISPARI